MSKLFIDNLVKNITEFEYLFNEIVIKYSVNNVLIVCGKSFESFNISKLIYNYFSSNNINFDNFSDFSPNPKLKDIKKGVNFFLKKKYDMILGIGGGSTIDVAKCIKIFSNNNNMNNYKDSSKLVPVNIPLIAIPTTAGTGSETTQFAVMYDDGVKISVDNVSLLPNEYILYPELLNDLSIYQKKSTILDSMFQAVESYWSINSTSQSKSFSIDALKLLLINNNYLEYIINNKNVYNDIMLASHFSGEAINITRTTAPHAMSYKLSELYNVPHGIAVAHCILPVLEFMVNNTDKCIDKRGKVYFISILDDLCKIFNVSIYGDLISKFYDIIYNVFNIDYIKSLDREKDIDTLVSSVNVERLKNNPIKLTTKDLREIYCNIIK